MADLIAGLETVGAATLGTDRAEHDAGEEEKSGQRGPLLERVLRIFVAARLRVPMGVRELSSGS